MFGNNQIVATEPYLYLTVTGISMSSLKSILHF